jgi:hypothetical protein
MGSGIPLAEQDQIVVGKPLPFAIFTADGKLLLAAGRIVESDRLRGMLIASGHTRGGSGQSSGQTTVSIAIGLGRRGPGEPEPEMVFPPGSLELLRRAYESATDRPAMSIARNEKEKACIVEMLGSHGQTIILTAPTLPDRSLVPVTADETWLCRTFQMTSAFRFSAQVMKVASEPFPHLHMQVQKPVERRKVRGYPRARLAVNAELRIPRATPCVVVDVSASGARLAVDSDWVLKLGQEVRLVMSLSMLGSSFELSLECSIVSALGAIDSRFPNACFYGTRFTSTGEKDNLVLHAFVSERLVAELYPLWPMLSTASASGGESS